jgi:toxin ParE1/3/4
LNLEIDPAAVVELEEHAAWYEARREGLGFELVAEARGAMARLVEQPGLGAPVPEAPSARRFALASFPFVVVYAVERDTLFVAAFAHTSRKPNYWRKRLAGG